MDRDKVPDHIRSMSIDLQNWANQAISDAHKLVHGHALNEQERAVWSGSCGGRVILSQFWTSIELDFYQQECAKRGLLFTGAHNLSWAHTTSDIARAVEIYSEVCVMALQTPDLGQGLGQGLGQALEGPPSQIPYRMQ